MLLVSAEQGNCRFRFFLFFVLLSRSCHLDDDSSIYFDQQSREAFSKNQLKQKSSKCSECTSGGAPREAPKQEAPKKQQQQQQGLTCSSCKKSQGKSNFSTNQLSKNDARKCKACTGAGGGGNAPVQAKGKGGGGGGKQQKKKEEKELMCESCGDELPPGEFSKNQLKKGDERNCRECVEELQYGGDDSEYDYGDLDDDEFEMPDLSPEMEELLQELLELGPAQAMAVLQDMADSGRIEEEAVFGIMMALEQLAENGDFDDDDEDEDEDEGEDDESDDMGEMMSLAEMELIESLGPEFVINMQHDFEAERAVLSRIKPLSTRNERVRAIFDWVNLKIKRLAELNPQMYSRAFAPLDYENVENSEEGEIENRIAAAEKAKASVCDAEIKSESIAAAAEFLRLEERLPSSEDLVNAAPILKGREEFVHLMLWSRGRRFDGILREDPAIVRYASEGNLEMVQALLAGGCDVDRCSAWSYKDFMYDRETALVAAARAGHKNLCQLLLKAGADPMHTFFDRDVFVKIVEEHKANDENDDDDDDEKDDEATEDKNPFAFVPPKFHKELAPEELTAATVLERDGISADILKLFQ